MSATLGHCSWQSAFASVNATLAHLCLGNNRIGVAGAMELAESLRINATLTHVNLSDNSGISDTAKRALRAACPPQCTLLMLNV
jgi:hypothetical protein